MKGVLITNGVITHMGLFSGIERAEQVYPPIIAAGIIVRCAEPEDECQLCKYHRDYWHDARYHMGEGYLYNDFKIASRRLHAEVLAREQAESENRVAAALATPS